MIATGNHCDFDSLRGAPLVRNDIVIFTDKRTEFFNNMGEGDIPLPHSKFS